MSILLMRQDKHTILSMKKEYSKSMIAEMIDLLFKMFSYYIHSILRR